MVSDKFVFFYGGPFSQWYHSPFIADGGYSSYNCAEQYMMAQKAEFFGDYEAQKDIMAAESPYIQKMVGRRVENFNEKTTYIPR